MPRPNQGRSTMEPKAGDIVHFEINTRDPERAKKFYSKAFGWKYKAPTVYFGTDDIDATLKKVRDAGGTADEKQPIPGQGWFAGCTDPDGNSFSLFQSDPSVTMETEHAHQEARA